MKANILVIAYNQHRRGAKKRGIAFELSFDDWVKIWEESGHLEERGPNGYNMCRFKDEGPYHKDNVYIAHNTQNKRDAWENGKLSHPPIGAKKGKKYPKRPNNPTYARGSQYTEEERIERRRAACRRYQAKIKNKLSGDTHA